MFNSICTVVYVQWYVYNGMCTMVCVQWYVYNGMCTMVCVQWYSETSLIRHLMGPENNVGLGGCWIMECLLPYLCMVTVPHIMVGLERMLDYRGVGLARFHCMCTIVYVQITVQCQYVYLQGEVVAHMSLCKV